jgi:zinc transporter ZupT
VESSIVPPSPDEDDRPQVVGIKASIREDRSTAGARLAYDAGVPLFATAIGLSALSAASAVTGTIAAFLAFDLIPGVLPYALALAAASFLYISMADLMPALHKGHVDVSAFEQLLLLLSGMVTAFFLRA